MSISPLFVQPPVPLALRTPRLLLRSWRASDAAALLPVLAADATHLGPWIPAAVATAVPLPELGARLARFAADFDANRSWRYAIVTPDETQVLGEADLFPRAAAGRVSLADADHVELGYWLASGATGQGFATEAARALLDVAASLPGMTHAEIRCDAANAPSAAVPRRLGFTLDRTEAETQVWSRPLAGAR